MTRHRMSSASDLFTGNNPFLGLAGVFRDNGKASVKPGVRNAESPRGDPDRKRPDDLRRVRKSVALPPLPPPLRGTPLKEGGFSTLNSQH